ncbi:MAG: aldo/keto reductase [Ginsengibacter sp.]
MQKLILGTVQLGIDYGINNINGKPAIEEAFQILNTAWVNNIHTLDTADAYGNAQDIIGKYHQRSGNRFTINSKFKGTTPVEVQLDKILDELQVDNLEVYFYHDFNDFISNETLLTELNKLKAKGKASKIGLSVYENEQMEMAINNSAIDVIQLPFNLFDNTNERGNLLTRAKENGKTIQVRSVYLQGLFFKAPGTLSPKLLPLNPYLVMINEMAKDFNLSVEELAMAYVIQQPLIDEIIIGVENSMQLLRNIELFTKDYSRDITEAVNNIKIPEEKLLYPKNWN